MFDAQGDNYLSVAPGANYALTPEHIDGCADMIARSAMLVMQMEIPLPATRRALSLATAHSVPVLFNFAPARTLELPITEQMTGLIVNEVRSGKPVRPAGQRSPFRRTSGDGIAGARPQFRDPDSGRERRISRFDQPPRSYPRRLPSRLKTPQGLAMCFAAL